MVRDVGRGLRWVKNPSALFLNEGGERAAGAGGLRRHRGFAPGPRGIPGPAWRRPALRQPTPRGGGVGFGAPGHGAGGARGPLRPWIWRPRYLPERRRRLTYRRAGGRPSPRRRRSYPPYWTSPASQDCVGVLGEVMQCPAIVRKPSGLRADARFRRRPPKLGFSQVRFAPAAAADSAPVKVSGVTPPRPGRRPDRRGGVVIDPVRASSPSSDPCWSRAWSGLPLAARCASWSPSSPSSCRCWRRVYLLPFSGPGTAPPGSKPRLVWPTPPGHSGGCSWSPTRSPFAWPPAG